MLRRTTTCITVAALVLSTLAACGDDESTQPEEDAVSTTITTPTTTDLDVNGTTLHVTEQGRGPVLLLVHGAGEDAAMLDGQAAALAATGQRVITYDRRGTGASGREDWPSGDADQHADDAAALIEALDAGPATVVGFSSGGVIALALAARHPDLVDRVVAWEPPALGVLPGADAINAEFMAPVTAHLDAHPGDLVGAQALLLTAILGFPVSVDDPAFAATRANAEAMVLDDPGITLRPFAADDLDPERVTIAVGSDANDAVAGAVAGLSALLGEEPLRIEGATHEVYLLEPSVLAEALAPLLDEEARS